MSFVPRNRVRVCLYQYDERPCHGTRPLRDVRQRDDNGENKGGAHQREKEETVVTPVNKQKKNESVNAPIRIHISAYHMLQV